MHQQESRKERDNFVDTLYNKIGLKVLHINEYDTEGLELHVANSSLNLKCNCGGSYNVTNRKRGYFLGWEYFSKNKCKGLDLKDVCNKIKA